MIYIEIKKEMIELITMSPVTVTIWSKTRKW